LSTVTLVSWQDVWDAFRRKDLRQALYDAGDVVMADCLLNLHGSEHRQRRRLENRLFRREVFRHWEDQILRSTIGTTLEPFVAAGSGDLVAIGYRLAMNLTATIAGLDVDPSDPAQTDELHGIVAKLSEGATLVHSTRDHDEVNAEVLESLEALDADFLAPAAALRRSSLDSESHHDVLTVLIRNEDDLELSHETVRREVGFYLQAGAHSTANALVHTFDHFHRWCHDQHVDVTEAGQDLALLQSALYESLRLHPASPVAWRRAEADIELSSGKTLESGDLVELDLVSANQDPAAFGPDAADFDPHRRLPEGIPAWGHSFGGGIHACIGQELDGGVPFEETGDGEPLFGTVAVMLTTLLGHGARPDPDDPPRLSTASTRAHYESYPVQIGLPA